MKINNASKLKTVVSHIWHSTGLASGARFFLQRMREYSVMRDSWGTSSIPMDRANWLAPSAVRYAWLVWSKDQSSHCKKLQSTFEILCFVQTILTVSVQAYRILFLSEEGIIATAVNRLQSAPLATLIDKGADEGRKVLLVSIMYFQIKIHSGLHTCMIPHSSCSSVRRNMHTLSITSLASWMGLAMLRTADTAPLASVLPSITIASISTSPLMFSTDPQPKIWIEKWCSSKNL